MATYSFAADITKFVKKTQIRGELVMKKLAFDAFFGIVMRSPVDTGRFRASWRIGIDTVDLTVEKDRKGKASPIKGKGGTVPPDSGELSGLDSKISGVKWGSTINITNNLIYGPPLERGHSKQAPQGMLKITFEEIKNNFSRTVQQVVSGNP